VDGGTWNRPGKTERVTSWTLPRVVLGVLCRLLLGFGLGGAGRRRGGPGRVRGQSSRGRCGFDDCKPRRTEGVREHCIMGTLASI